MAVFDEQKNRIKDDIEAKARNNHDREAVVHPSDYGFDRKQEDAQTFCVLVEDLFPGCVTKIIGKNTVQVNIDKLR